MRVLLVLGALVLSFSGCGADNSRTEAALGTGGLRWSSFPVDIRADNALYDGGPAEEDLFAAVAFWENRAGKPLFRLSPWPHGQAPFTGSITDPDTLLGNVIFFQRPWPNSGDWSSQIAGKTVIHSNGGAIGQAVIFLNGETPLCASLCDREGEHEETSRRRLLAHELGHVLGFAHIPSRANIMYPEIEPGGSLEDEEVDVNLLRRLTF